MDAAVIYWSKTGNTEKAARAIRDGLVAEGATVHLVTVGRGGSHRLLRL